MTTPKKPKAETRWSFCSEKGILTRDTWKNEYEAVACMIADALGAAAWNSTPVNDRQYLRVAAEAKGYRCIRVLITPIENE